MNVKKQILKIVLLVTWVVLGGGVLVLLVAARNIKNSKTCKGILVEISGVKEFLFLDKKDILQIINTGSEGAPEGMAVADFNLGKLENLLKRNVWVRDANLFFDNNLWLHVNVVEKEPVARIFTLGNTTFYIDSAGSRMPLSTKMNVRLPVFTGYPSNRSMSGASDSMLLKHIRTLSQYILNNEFWMAQVAQVAITPEHNFEMVPTIGRHIIQFGDGENYEDKFKRLFIFYSQVLSRVGFDKYSKVIVQYDKQVIGINKGPVPKIDSLQALKNIKKMIDESRRISEDSSYVPLESFKPVKAIDESLTMQDDEELSISDTAETRVAPVKVSVPAKNTGKEAGPAKSRPVNIQTDKSKPQPKPKAVMKKPESIN
jgi:cell division protein FtsQ